jgi:uncharacterized protein (TIGR02117 family)
MAKLRRWLKWPTRLLVAFLGMIALYLLVAVVLGVIPVNRHWRPPATGVEVFVHSNGVHTDFTMPVRNAQMDWFTRFPFEHFAKPWPEATHVAVGWGDRGFFLEARTWADVRIPTVLRALFFLSTAAMHVTWAPLPVEGPSCKRVVLTEAQYGRLCEFIVGSFRTDERGAFRPILGHGYRDWDTFYEGLGAYSLFYTCNGWTNEALKVIGVRTAAWSPFVQGILGHL